MSKQIFSLDDIDNFIANFQNRKSAKKEEKLEEPKEIKESYSNYNDSAVIQNPLKEGNIIHNPLNDFKINRKNSSNESNGKPEDDINKMLSEQKKALESINDNNFIKMNLNDQFEKETVNNNLIDSKENIYNENKIPFEDENKKIFPSENIIASIKKEEKREENNTLFDSDKKENKTNTLFDSDKKENKIDNIFGDSNNGNNVEDIFNIPSINSIPNTNINNTITKPIPKRKIPSFTKPILKSQPPIVNNTDQINSSTVNTENKESIKGNKNKTTNQRIKPKVIKQKFSNPFGYKENSKTNNTNTNNISTNSNTPNINYPSNISENKSQNIQSYQYNPASMPISQSESTVTNNSNENKIFNQSEINPIQQQNNSYMNSNENLFSEKPNDLNSSVEINVYSSKIQNNKVFYPDKNKKINLVELSSLLDSNKDKLFKSYFPYRYSAGFNKENILSYLQIINQRINLKSSSLGKIALFLLNFLIERELDLDKTEFFAKRNKSTQNEFLSLIRKIVLNPYGVENISNVNGYSQYCKNNLSLENFLHYSIITSNQIELNEYISNMFENNVIPKNNYFYFYFLLKTNKIMNCSQKDFDIIIKNFPLFLLSLVEYSIADNIEGNTDSILKKILQSQNKNMNLIHYIIISILGQHYEIENEKFLSKLFSKYLNNSTIEKIILADTFNLILYSYLKADVPKMIPKISILIKLEYVLLCNLNDKYLNEKVKELSEKIYQSSSQLGNVSKNNYFLNDMRYDLLLNDDGKYEGIPKLVSPIGYMNQPNIEGNKKEKDNSQKENKAEEPVKKRGGFFGFFGFGGSKKEEAVSKPIQQEKIYDAFEESRQWKKDHPGEEEIYWDDKLKRWILRGQCETEPEVVPKQFNLPPPKTVKRNQNEEMNQYDDNYNNKSSLYKRYPSAFNQ